MIPRNTSSTSARTHGRASTSSASTTTTSSSLSNARILLTNLQVLGFDANIHLKDTKIQLNEQVFLLGADNTKAFEVISYFLFYQLDKKKAKSMFKFCWPVQTKDQASLYKKIAFGWLQELKSSHRLLQGVQLRMSNLKNCRGDVMNKIFMALSTCVVEQVATRKNQDVTPFKKTNNATVQQELQNCGQQYTFNENQLEQNKASWSQQATSIRGELSLSKATTTQVTTATATVSKQSTRSNVFDAINHVGAKAMKLSENIMDIFGYKERQTERRQQEEAELARQEEARQQALARQQQEARQREEAERREQEAQELARRQEAERQQALAHQQELACQQKEAERQQELVRQQEEAEREERERIAEINRKRKEEERLNAEFLEWERQVEKREQERLQREDEERRSQAQLYHQALQRRAKGEEERAQQLVLQRSEAERLEKERQEKLKRQEEAYEQEQEELKRIEQERMEKERKEYQRLLAQQKKREQDQRNKQDEARKRALLYVPKYPPLYQKHKQQQQQQYTQSPKKPTTNTTYNSIKTRQKVYNILNRTETAKVDPLYFLQIPKSNAANNTQQLQQESTAVASSSSRATSTYSTFKQQPYQYNVYNKPLQQSTTTSTASPLQERHPSMVPNENSNATDMSNSLHTPSSSSSTTRISAAAKGVKRHISTITTTTVVQEEPEVEEEQQDTTGTRRSPKRQATAATTTANMLYSPDGPKPHRAINYTSPSPLRIATPHRDISHLLKRDISATTTQSNLGTNASSQRSTTTRPMHSNYLFATATTQNDINEHNTLPAARRTQSNANARFSSSVAATIQHDANDQDTLPTARRTKLASGTNTNIPYQPTILAPARPTNSNSRFSATTQNDEQNVSPTARNPRLSITGSTLNSPIDPNDFLTFAATTSHKDINDIIPTIPATEPKIGTTLNSPINPNDIFSSFADSPSHDDDMEQEDIILSTRTQSRFGTTNYFKPSSTAATTSYYDTNEQKVYTSAATQQSNHGTNAPSPFRSLTVSPARPINSSTNYKSPSSRRALSVSAAARSPLASNHFSKNASSSASHQQAIAPPKTKTTTSRAMKSPHRLSTAPYSTIRYSPARDSKGRTIFKNTIAVQQQQDDSASDDDDDDDLVLSGLQSVQPIFAEQPPSTLYNNNLTPLRGIGLYTPSFDLYKYTPRNNH